MADDGESLATGRSRRTKQDKSGRLAALEKLRGLKGQKNKYEVGQMQNVYEVVDEKTYSETVGNRQRDDWIIDDGTGEYVEDGREIFDDDIDEEETAALERKKKSKLNRKDKDTARVEKQANQANFHSVRDMLSNMPMKRKRADAPSTSASAKVNEDDLMSDLMQELKNEKKSTSNAQIFKKLMSQPMDPLPKLKPKSMPIKHELKKFKPCTTYDTPDYSSDYVRSSSPVVHDVEDAPSPPSTHDDFSDVFDDEPMDFACSDDVPVPAPSKSNSNPVIKTEPMSQDIICTRAIVGDVKVKVEPGINKLDMVDDISKYMEDEFASGEMKCVEGIGTSDSAAPTMEGETSGTKTLNFYWLDMYEEPRNPGCIFLFGKVKKDAVGTYSSCCVVVKNLERKMYVLPKETNDDGEPVIFMDVYQEFSETILPKYKINNFKSRKVEKNYCFDLEDVPPHAGYIEIRYAGNLPILPQDLKGKTFSRILGSNNPIMETFLLEKCLKGPGWLQITDYESVPIEKQQSWSKFEFACDVTRLKIHPDSASLPPPTLTLVSLNIQSVSDPSAKKDSIIFAGVAVNKNFQLESSISSNSIYQDYFCLLNKPPGEIWPLDVDRIVNKRTLKMDSERSMLGCLLAKLHQLDPDVYLGHDLNFELLMMQLLHFKVPHWSRIGRLKRSTPVTKSNKMLDFKAALAGRLLCDVKISAMELIRARSYDLPSLGSQVLGMKEDEIGTLSGPEMRQLFDTSEGLRGLVRWGMQHCVLNIRLINELQVMPLAVQITTIAGNTLSRTLLGGRSERNEYLLLHAFNARDFIVPDKYKPFAKNVKKEPTEEGDEKADADDKKDGKSSGPSYSGGLVLTPKRGFYDDYIVLMDFNSLYPSIIQEYNVCFTTGVGAAGVDGSDHFDHEAAADGAKGVLPEEIRKLVESRKQVKALMKAQNVSPDMMKQYDIRQKALKLTANSMYGCLGFRMSRFYAKNLAAYITGKGRDILLKTKDAVEKMGFEVIYGDTDSLMINSHTQNLQEVWQIGNKIKAEVNRTYKLLELEIDGIFRFLLLLKKKKYAALICNPKPNGEHEYVMELKGLDIVRRDWAPIGANTAKACLNEIMSEQPIDDKVYKVCEILNAVSKRLRQGDVPLKDLLITKQLAKHPEEYKDAVGLYHVKVALRMNESGKMPKKFRSGDTVSYLFCTDGLPHHLIELSQPTEVKKDEVSADGTKMEVVENKPLIPDPEYYLANQVHPVVSRICDPIPGLDPARVAEALGLDSTAFKRRQHAGEDNHEDKYLGRQSEAERYTQCEKFVIECVNCSTRIELVSSLFQKNGESSFSVVTCPNIDCNKVPWNSIVKLKNKLTLFMRKFVKKYYANTFICEDPSCSNTTSCIPLQLQKGYPVCSCKQALMYKDYSDEQLYLQLNYLSYVFNLPKAIEELKKEEKVKLKQTLFKQRDSNGKGEIEAIYDDLKSFVDKTLAASAYSHVDLTTVCSLQYQLKSMSVNAQTSSASQSYSATQS